MARVGSLGLGPSDPCYDPQHPWWLFNFYHTAYECQCMAEAGLDKYNWERQCAFPASGGTPTTYVKRDDVPSTAEVIAMGPGYAAGQVANVAGELAGAFGSGVGDGLTHSLNLPGMLVIAGLGFVAYQMLLRR